MVSGFLCQLSRYLSRRAMKIAILSSEAALSKILSAAGYNVIPFNSAKELQNDQFDMLIVDNDISEGASKIIASAKEKCSAILFIASHVVEDQIVSSLVAGATDYLIKPVRRHELISRLEVLRRRTCPNQFASEKLEFGQYLFETHSARVAVSGQLIELTRKEFNLALLLFRHIDRPLSRAYLLDAVWSSELDIPSRTLDTHISRVRTKLKLRPENGFRLVPVYSFGYQLLQIGNASF